MKLVEFLFYALALMVMVAGLTFGIDRELARRDYERYSTTQQELIVGCIFTYNCKHYNDMLEEDD